jgi:hypothetical protein
MAGGEGIERGVRSENTTPSKQLFLQFTVKQ